VQDPAAVSVNLTPLSQWFQILQKHRY
jgi:hypothetical protein